MDLFSSRMVLSWEGQRLQMVSGKQGTHILVGQADLVDGLLEAALGFLDAGVALAHVLLHVDEVVPVEVPGALLRLGGLLVLGLQSFVVDLGALAEVLFGVGEEVVGAVADEVRAADLGIGDVELGRLLVEASHGSRAHQLLWGLVSAGGRMVGIIRVKRGREGGRGGERCRHTKQTSLLCGHVEGMCGHARGVWLSSRARVFGGEELARCGKEMGARPPSGYGPITRVPASPSPPVLPARLRPACSLAPTRAALRCCNAVVFLFLALQCPDRLRPRQSRLPRASAPAPTPAVTAPGLVQLPQQRVAGRLRTAELPSVPAITGSDPATCTHQGAASEIQCGALGRRELGAAAVVRRKRGRQRRGALGVDRGR